MRDFPWAIILIFALVVIVLSIVTFASEQARQALPVEPQTADVCLEFPDGYELAGVSQVARQLAVEAPVFYCRNIETGQYRQCVPREVVCK